MSETSRTPSASSSAFLAFAGRIDRLNAAVGRGAAWLCLFVVVVQFAVVVLRYAFGLGSARLSESIIYGHAGLFMLASAWTLQTGGHVRVDVFYADASPRTRALVDLGGSLLLLLPFMAVLGWFAAPYVARSWAIFESSRETSGLPVVFLLKTLIPVFALLMALQGVSQAIKAWNALARRPAVTPMLSPELLAILMVVAVCCLLFAGYPVALTLGGVSLAFAVLGHITGAMSFSFLGALPQRVYGVMTNEVLLAIPLFIFMGVMLERSRIAEDLLETMARLFGTLRGGLGISVAIVGTLLAAAKGVVGATTVTMGLIVLPTMLRHGYDKKLAAGTVAATATLAQIFPPATVLVLLGDQLSTAYQAAQLAQGNFAPSSVTVSDLFAGALIPGFALVAMYLLYLVFMAVFFPHTSPAIPPDPGAPKGFALLLRRLLAVLVAPILLILAVLGSILGGIATPTEAASVGAVGAILLAALKRTLGGALGEVVQRTAQVTSMIFVILIGATLFSLVFVGLGGDDMVHRALGNLPGGAVGAILVVMLGMFLLGFVMDAFEIIFVVVPIVAVPLLKLHGVDPVWLGVMMAMNLQTSYMHPPLGPTLFFLRGVAPPEITTRHIYLGIIPFVGIQLFALVVLWYAPGLATALPHALYGGR